MNSIRAREFEGLSNAWTPQVYPKDVSVTVQAVDLPVSLPDAKDFLRVYDNADDLQITMLLQGVIEQVERYINRSIMLKTYKAFWERVGSYVRLPYVPYDSIVSAVSKDVEGNSQTLVSGTNYFVIGTNDVQVRLFGLNYDYLEITYKAGYTTPEQVPGNIKSAILQELALQYKNRQDANVPKIVVNGLTLEARNLLQSYIDYVV